MRKIENYIDACDILGGITKEQAKEAVHLMMNKALDNYCSICGLHGCENEKVNCIQYAQFKQLMED